MRIIKNTSVYKTKRLKSLFCYIHEGIAYWGEGRLPQWKELRIKVRGGKRRCSGWAYYPSYIGSMWHEYDMFLTLSENANLSEIAQLFGHELMHSYGYKHRQFRSEPLGEHSMKQIMERFVSAEDLKI